MSAPEGFEASPETTTAWQKLRDDWKRYWVDEPAYGVTDPGAKTSRVKKGTRQTGRDPGDGVHFMSINGTDRSPPRAPQLIPSTEKRPPQGKSTEADVSGTLVRRLIRCLGWKNDQCFAEPKLHIQVGSNSYPVSPDFVLAPDLDAASTIGKAYAVIEVKRKIQDEKDRESARQQARSYAGHLRVPFYAVVDGTHIVVWERCLLKDDDLVLEVQIQNLLEKRRELERLLGAQFLPGFATERRVNPSGSVAEALEKAATHPNNVILRIRGRQLYATLENGDALNTDAAFWWGSPAAPEEKRWTLDVDRDGELADEVNFVDLICRLLHHRAIGALHVFNPDAWRKALRERPLLLGSKAGVDSDINTRICPRHGEVRDPGDPLSDGSPIEEWTRELSASLDAWMVERIHADLDRLFCGDNVPGLDLARWTMGEGLISALRDYRGHGASREQLNVIILLAIVNARTGGNAMRYKPLAHVRLGPASRQALVEGLLFGLALSATFDSVHFFADDSDADLNMRYHQTARGLVFGLDGLRQHGDLPTTNEWNSVFHRANLLALTRSSRDRIELTHARTIGSPPLFSHGNAPTMGDKHPLGIVFTFDDDTINKAARGWEALRNTLNQQYKKQTDPGRARP